MTDRRGPRRGRAIPWVMAAFYAGGAAGWWLHATMSTRDVAPVEAIAAARPETRAVEAPVEAPPAPAATAGADRLAPRPAADTADVPVIGPDPIADLRRRHLKLPIDGADVPAMEGAFNERRGGGARGHEAVDFLAPRNTPVRAVDGGRIAKLFVSKAGGTTIYQFDPTGRFCYYYAHLQRYADGLHEGQEISQGETIGYVGTTGNAPPNTPHLHFAINALTPARQWWQGQPLDPYLAYR